jgi:hypothetical protein
MFNKKLQAIKEKSNGVITYFDFDLRAKQVMVAYVDCLQWPALKALIQSECIMEKHVDFSIYLSKSDVDDIKEAMIEEFETTDRVIFVINQPKGTQRGRFFVNGPLKESAFIHFLVDEAAERLELLDKKVRARVDMQWQGIA